MTRCALLPNKNSPKLLNVADRVEGVFNTLRPGSNGLVLIGGCSRTGKSTLAEELRIILNSRGIAVVLFPLDSWLLPITERRPCTPVIERYRVEELSNSVMSLLENELVHVKPYDSKTRTLSSESKIFVPPSPPFVVIAEGVIALAVEKLREISIFNLLVQSRECIRIKRLIRFYRDFKNLEKSEYKSIIMEREIEEVPFVKSTWVFADLVLASEQ